MRLRENTVRVVLPGSAVALLLLCGCAEEIEERSFTDKDGRTCAYVLVKEADGDKDVGDIDCDYPSPVSPPASPSPVSPSPAPSPTE